MTRRRPKTLDQFDTAYLLRAVDEIDAMRAHLDGDGHAPPVMRNELLRLHKLASEVVNEGLDDESARRELFDLALSIQERLDDLERSLEQLRSTIDGLVAMAPDEFEA